MTALAEKVAAAFKAACLDELDAPKPGNVHVFASGHRMTAAEFVRSAEAAAAPIAMPGARVGARILGAVEATSTAVGANTNLGIILLCAPLAVAAECEVRGPAGRARTRAGVLDIQDAELAFRAIARAAPAGLGRVERHDVAETATVTLKAPWPTQRAAIESPTNTPAISKMFSSWGAPAARCAPWRARPSPNWATLAVYLDFLSAFPDSHIVRKHGIRDCRGNMPRRVAISSANAIGRANPAVCSPISDLGCQLKERGDKSRNQRGPHRRDAVRAPVADHLAVGSNND